MFSGTFILAAVSKPILGDNFLSANHLLVDPHFDQALDVATLDPISRPGPHLASPVSPLHSVKSRPLSALSSPLFPLSSATAPEHRIRSSVSHSITMTGRPVFATATFGSGKAPDYRSRIPELEKSWYRAVVKFTVVFSSPQGSQAGWLLETMWRLPPVEFGRQA
jgi:hypothetical protein